jgi:hypothetical protein
MLRDRRRRIFPSLKSIYMTLVHVYGCGPVYQSREEGSSRVHHDSIMGGTTDSLIRSWPVTLRLRTSTAAAWYHIPYLGRGIYRDG